MKNESELPGKKQTIWSVYDIMLFFSALYQSPQDYVSSQEKQRNDYPKLPFDLMTVIVTMRQNDKRKPIKWKLYFICLHIITYCINMCGAVYYPVVYHWRKRKMTIDEFLKKHKMTAYRLGKITGIDHAMITKYRSGKTTMAKHYKIFFDTLSYALDHGYRPAGLDDGRARAERKKE